MPPTLIITCGPTASGKSSLPEKVQNLLNIQGGNFESFLIDDLVEQNPYYKKKVKEYIENERQKNGKTKEQIVEMFLKPTPKMIQDFNYYYAEARKTTNCETGADLRFDWGKSCDILNDLNLTQAFNSGKNIAFESRGVTWPQWFFDLFQCQLKHHKYTIIVAWTVVDMCELLERNKTRAETSVSTFLDNPEKNLPPRLPDIRPDAYKVDLQKIIDTFKTQVKRQTSCRKDCIRLLVFDNNTRNSVLLYDNQGEVTEKKTKDAAIAAIKKYNVKRRCVGGRHITKRNKRLKKKGTKNKRKTKKNNKKRK